MTARSIPAELRPTGVSGRFRSRPATVALIGVALLVVALVAAVTVGSIAIGPTDTLGVILKRAFGLDLGGQWTAATETIV